MDTYILLYTIFIYSFNNFDTGLFIYIFKYM